MNARWPLILALLLIASILPAQDPLPGPPAPPAAAASRPDYARACPPETLVYLEGVGLRDLWARAKEQALASVPADRRARIERRFARAADEFVERISEQFGTDIRTFAENLDDAMFALTELRLPVPPLPGSDPGATRAEVRATTLVAIRTVDPGLLRRLLDAEVEKKTASAAAPILGGAAYEIPLRGPVETPPGGPEPGAPLPDPEALLGASLYAALDGPIAWFSNDRPTLEASVGRVRRPPPPPEAPGPPESLADTPRFAAARAAAGGYTCSLGSADLDRILGLVEESLDRDALREFQKAEAHVGFRGLRSIVTWSSVRGDQVLGGFALDGTGEVSLYQAIRQEAGPKELPAVVPAPAGLAVFFSIPDPAAGWKRVRRWLGEHSALFDDQTPEEMDEQMERAQQELGVPWDELASALDDEAALFLLPGTAKAPDPEPGICIEVKEPAAALRLLDRLAEGEVFREANGGTPYLKRDYQGVPIHESGRPDGIHFAAVGRSIVFAPSVATVEAAIDAGRTGGGLALSPKFTGALAALPTRHSKLIYYDTGWFLRNFSTEGGLSPSDRDLIGAISAEGGGVAATLEEPERLLVVGSSKLSAQALSSGLSFLLIPEMLGGGKARREEIDCANHLREIGSGIAAWVDAHGGGDFPDDLGAVQAEMFPGEEGLFHCPADPQAGYGYLPPVTADSIDPTLMLVFKTGPRHADGESVEVLFSDFHVESLPAPVFRAALAEQCRLLDQAYAEALTATDREIGAATDATGREKLTKRKEGLARRAAEVGAMRLAAEAALRAGAPPPSAEPEDGPPTEAPPPEK